MKKILQIKNLNVAYSSKKPTLKNFNLNMHQGEIVGIVGESGSGKTTAAQSILRLLPLAKISGKIFFEEKELLSLREKELRKIRGKNIGMIFQDPQTSLNPTMIIGKQICENLKLHLGLNKRQAKQKAKFWMQEVGIVDSEIRFSQYPHELSGGMRQRVMIAMALCTYPSLIIADEPTSALDVTIQLQVLELIKRLQKKYKMSVLFISHDFGVISYLCDRILVMHEGSVVEEGSLENILNNAKHPYTQLLLNTDKKTFKEKFKNWHAKQLKKHEKAPIASSKNL